MVYYTSITIIYNPNSTGSGKTLAQNLAKRLRSNMPDQPVKLMPTKHAGHAESLAYKLAMASKRPLIISASGDGGYHEIVNGLMKAQAEGASPTAGLLPAGNANDHYHHIHEGDTAVAIQKHKEQKIDLLKLTTTSSGEPLERYAHSYIGVGLTPKVGQELNKTQLNLFKEAWIVMKVLFILQPTRLRVNGKVRTYDSLIFSNVAKMSKILTVSKKSRINDGKFEITAFTRRNKLKLISVLLRASTRGLPGDRQAKRFVLETLRRTIIQLDGEIMTLDENSKVLVELEHMVLKCVV